MHVYQQKQIAVLRAIKETQQTILYLEDGTTLTINHSPNDTSPLNITHITIQQVLTQPNQEHNQEPNP